MHLGRRITKPFISVLSQALFDAAPDDYARLQIGDTISSAHMRTVKEYGTGVLLDNLDDETRSWVEPEINKVTDTWKKKHPKEGIPDFRSKVSQEDVQTLGENLQTLARSYMEGLIELKKGMK